MKKSTHVCFDNQPNFREIDARVAEQIFGLTVYHLHDEYFILEEDGLTINIPNFSTNISDAWQIVETFRLGWQGHAAACIDIKISDWVTKPDCWVAIWAPDLLGGEASTCSVPLAICKAALKVVENAM